MMMAYLEVVGEPDTSPKRVDFAGDELLVGRDPQARVRLGGAQISRRHGRFYRRQGQIWIEDLGSANGILVDGVPLGESRPLQAGARVQVGSYTITLHMQPLGGGAAGTADPASAAAAGPVPAMVWVAAQPEGHGVPHRIALPVGPFEVGRGAQASVRIDDGSISRCHAAGEVYSTGEARLEDAGSRNGTFVNDERLSERRIIMAGDQLRFGNVHFRVEAAQSRAHEADALDAGGDAARRMVHLDVGRPGAAPTQLPADDEIPLLRSVVSYDVPHLMAQAKPHGGQVRRGQLIAAVAMAAMGLLVALATRHILDRRQQQRDEAEIGQRLREGQALLRQGAWSQALGAFGAVLRRAPLHAAARLGRHHAELHQDFEAAVAAIGDVDDPAAAGPLFVHLAPLLADAEAAALGERPKQMLQQAKARIAQNCALEALGACRAGSWARCRDTAVCAVLFDADNVLGAALLDQALEMAPNPPLDGAPLAAAPRRRAALAARYPATKLRAAVLAYATGDLPAAGHQVRQLRGHEVAEVSAALYALGVAQKTGDLALARGNAAAAIRAYEGAVALDARLLPPGQPSVLGRSLLERGTGLWLREGERAFNRGRYSEALAAWQRGLQLDPTHRGLVRAVERLEARAQQILDATGRAGSRGRGDCAQLREVAGMVRRDQPLYQATLDRLAACPAQSR